MSHVNVNWSEKPACLTKSCVTTRMPWFTRCTSCVLVGLWALTSQTNSGYERHPQTVRSLCLGSFCAVFFFLIQEPALARLCLKSLDHLQASWLESCELHICFILVAFAWHNIHGKIATLAVFCLQVVLGMRDSVKLFFFSFFACICTCYWCYHHTIEMLRTPSETMKIIPPVRPIQWKFFKLT